jgi:hypothetical protein
LKRKVQRNLAEAFHDRGRGNAIARAVVPMADAASISPKERAILIIAHKMGNDISLYAMSFGVDDAEFAG